MIRYLAILLLGSLSFTIDAQVAVEDPLAIYPAPERYIREHAPLALTEMYYSGIPSSIKLAQGILESGCGQSRLARDGANHFGIKCKTYWLGDTVLVKDDDLDSTGQLIESCFRKYPDVAQSYKDHSEFLMNTPRYSDLFQIDRTDYTAWANGLQRCGYATNPQYANLLIALVERYNLHVFDRVPEHAIADCLDYYDTQLYVENHQRNSEESTIVDKPKPVFIPKNYKGGWLRENTRMRMLTSLIENTRHKLDKDVASVVTSPSEGFLGFEVPAATNAQ